MLKSSNLGKLSCASAKPGSHVLDSGFILRAWRSIEKPALSPYRRLKFSRIETKLANIGVRAEHISSNATLKDRPYDQSILEAKMKTNTTLAGWYSSTA